MVNVFARLFQEDEKRFQVDRQDAREVRNEKQQHSSPRVVYISETTKYA